MTVRIGFKTSPQDTDWPALDEAWARAGELGVFDSGWLNDHLTNMDPVTPGPSFESLTLLAALAHHVPGLWLGHAVLSNTFRHPVLVAKAATLLDHVTGGRFILGLGAGWFEGEHGPFGIDLPPIKERIDRLVAAVDVLEALWSPAAAILPGVTSPDRFYPLHDATNLPPPLTPGGPPIYLGGQRPRGIALAARSASGWLVPGTHAGDPAYLAEKRDELLRAFEAIGRDPSGFDFVAQVAVPADPALHRETVATARAMVERGATHIILASTASLGAAGVEAVARGVALPLRDAIG